MSDNENLEINQLIKLGIQYNENKEYDKVLECYSKAVVLNNEATKVLYQKSLTYYDMKEFEKGRDCYLQIVRIHQDKVSKGYYDDILKNMEYGFF